MTCPHGASPRYRERVAVPRAMIDVFVETVLVEDAKELRARSDDKDTAFELLVASFSTTADATDINTMRRLLYRRGYSESTACRAIDSFFERSHLD